MDFFKLAKKKAELVRAYREFFSTPNGKLIIDDLISECLLMCFLYWSQTLFRILILHIYCTC